MKAICVFTGSKHGQQQAYTDLARGLGEAIAKRGLALVYGGGGRGLMGEVAKSAHAVGGKVIGVRPTGIILREGEVLDEVENHLVDNMAERKDLMAELSDAFIALPGGVGTIDEIAEMMTWLQLGFHDKPCGFLDNTGYYTELYQFFERGVTEGFIRDADWQKVIKSESPDDIIDRLEAAHAKSASTV